MSTVACIVSAGLGAQTAPPPEQIPAPTPPTLVPGVSVDTGGSLDVIPPFRTDPLITWGPVPAGTVRKMPPLTYDLQHQVITVHFDWARHAVIGTTTLQVAALDSSIQTLELDAVDMKIRRVTTTQQGKATYDYDNKRLIIHLPKTVYPETKTSVTIEYEAADRKKGVYFIDRGHYLWTQGEPEETRYWVPTNDRPDDKTTWQITVTTDTSERALSNGRLVGSRKAAGQTQWTWAQEKPASTYLMSIVTGKYTVIKDHADTLAVNYWTYPDSVEAARRGFGRTPQAIALFARKTGVPFPWAKYDQIVVPDFIFGGMENVSATTQNDDRILHPASAEPQANADGLMAHELGHQWYGNLVTAQDWAHVWLNEGFATFMEQIFREEVNGASEGALDRFGAAQEAIKGSQLARRPLVYNRWVDAPIELFRGGHIYPRGAAVLQMLRHQLGDSLFWAAMHNYTVEYAYKPVVTEDFRKSFEKTTSWALKPFFDQWVYGAGFPVFQVSYTFDSKTRQLRLQAKEVQPQDSLTGFFDADVDVEIWTDSGAMSRVMQVRDGSGRLVLVLPATLRSIRWNKGKWVLELTDFPRPANMLLYQLTHDDDVLGRIEAVDLLHGWLNNRVVVDAIVTTAKSDSNWSVRVHALQALALAQAGREAAEATVSQALDDKDSRVRVAAAQASIAFPGKAAVTEHLSDLAQHDGSFFVRGAALAAYLTLRGDDGLTLAEQVLETPSWRNELRTPVLAVLKQMSGAKAQALYTKYAPPPK